MPPIAPARPPCGAAASDPETGRPAIEEAPFDELALVPAGVDAGGVPLGPVAGADRGTAPDAVWDPPVVRGMDAAGATGTDEAGTDDTLGTVAEGALGTVTDGTVTDGTVTDGTVTDGTVTPATVTPGTVTDGVVIVGTGTDELPGTDTVGGDTASALLVRGCTAKTASSARPRAATAAIQRFARVDPPVPCIRRVPIGLPLIASNSYPTLINLTVKLSPDRANCRATTVPTTSRGRSRRFPATS